LLAVKDASANAGVSVVIPAHNAAHVVAEAIQSALDQTQPPREIIVVDDGSSDGTGDVVKRFGERVQYVRQPSGGPASARNRGIMEAEGEAIAFLDADDLWLPMKLERQVPVLTVDEGCVFTYSDCKIIDGAGGCVPSFLRQKTRVGTGWIVQNLLEENFIATSSVLARRRAVLDAGGFDESLRSVEDRDLWLRLASQGTVGLVDEVLVIKRHLGKNISMDDLLATESRIRVLDKAMRWLREIPQAEAVLPIARLALARECFELGHCLLGREEISRARAALRRSWGTGPLASAASIYWVWSFLPRSLRATLRQAWRMLRSVRRE
jgi:glycosyltransferase involved in cell wall biosynthesis